MNEYEVELGAMTERRDAKTGTPFGVDVEVYVQRTESAATVEDAATGSYEVSFDVEDGSASFAELDGEPYNDLALVAARAAARELDEMQDDYEVRDPVAAVADRDYEVFDASRSSDD